MVLIGCLLELHPACGTETRENVRGPAAVSLKPSYPRLTVTLGRGGGHKRNGQDLLEDWLQKRE